MSVKTIYQSSEKSEHKSEMEVYANDSGELFIYIYDPEDEQFYSNFICLDKKTAIKLVRHIKREISFLPD